MMPTSKFNGYSTTSGNHVNAPTSLMPWTGMVAVDDTVLAVSDTGGVGFPVIYLNGHFATQRYWRKVIAELEVSKQNKFVEQNNMEMSNTRSLGSKFSEARKKSQLSQAGLAKQISISPQAVGKWERGEAMPDINTLTRLSAIFDVDLNYFSDNWVGEVASTNSAQSKKQTIEIQPVNQPESFGSNWDMSQGNWIDSDFSGLKNLKKISSSNMKNCKFRNANLSGLRLEKSNIELSAFSSSNLRSSKIHSSNLLNNQFVSYFFIGAEFLKNNISMGDFFSHRFFRCGVY